MRAEKIAMTKRFRDEEAKAVNESGKLENPSSSTPTHTEKSGDQELRTAVLT